MNSYEKIYDESIGNYGLITSTRASELGISNMTLVLLAQRGRLLHIRRGLYRLAHYVPTEYDGFAQAVMTVGENAYLYGESVIALLNLAPTNPAYFYVAQSGRSRKVLPGEIILKASDPGYTPILIQGIRCQRVGDAILSAKDTVPRDRLMDAAREAYRTGHLDKEESEQIIRELEASR